MPDRQNVTFILTDFLVFYSIASSVNMCVHGFKPCCLHHHCRGLNLGRPLSRRLNVIAFAISFLVETGTFDLLPHIMIQR